MCGLAGIATRNGVDIPEQARLGRMVAAIRHRGPDDEGYYRAQGIGLGHARLSIIDVDGGGQPIHNEDRSVWISYNGEVFNYLELRLELEKQGHRFYTRTDTEVIVHLYEQYGHDFVHHLNGQFAVALWDVPRQKLVLARDRAGILPLYYSEGAKGLVFGSEVKSLLASGLVGAELDPAGLNELFTCWCPVAPRTVFSGVRQVCPGEIVVYSKGRLTRQTYWDWSFPPESELTARKEADLAEELEDILNDATRIRLRADVPVGAYLSGGLDSSSLVSLIKRQNISDLHTFSVTFEEKALDESRHQDSVVAHLGTKHSSVGCNDLSISEGFAETVWHTETPVLRTAPVPMKMLSAHVRRSDYKVVLTGEGADEVLGGYDIFKEAKVRAFWAKQPGSEWRPTLLKRLYPYMDFSSAGSQAYLQAFFKVRQADVAGLSFAHEPRWNMTSQLKMFYSDELKSALRSDEASPALDSPDGWRSWHMFNRWEHVEAKTILPGYILSSQGDRMLMANSVEGRFPFLDHRLIEFAARIPPRYKMRGMNEKNLLKKVMSKHLPEEIVNRHKQPYRAPSAGSFNNPAGRQLLSDFLRSPELGEAGYFDRSRVEKLLGKFEKSGNLSERDGMALIGILATQIWHRHFVEHTSWGSSRAVRQGDPKIQVAEG